MKRWTEWLIGTLILAGLNALGWWWATPLLGLVFALRHPLGRALGYSLLAGAVAWTLPLFVLYPADGVMRQAGLIGAIMGIGDLGAVVLVVPALVGGLLALMAAWIVGAARRVLPLQRAVETPATTESARV